jgi:ZIP family zinc transporter
MSSEIVTAVLLLSTLSFVTTAAGVAVALWLRSSDRIIAAGIGFSVGIMVLIALFELLPAALADAGWAVMLLAVAAGAAVIAMAHRLIPHRHLVTESAEVDPAMIRSAYLVVLGLVLHDLPEGFAMANAYVAAPTTGFVTAIAIALHNLPEEFAMAAPVVAISRPRALFGAALLSAAAEPMGAMIGLVAVGVSPSFNGAFLALAAGAMLFVSVHELLPMARRHGHRAHFAAGAAASALVYGLLAALPAALAVKTTP